MTNGNFTENTTELGYGGIYIENISMDKDASTYLSMINSVISNNKAQQAAAIYVSTRSLTDESIIQNVTFENNESNERGAVFLSFDGGIMEISENIFKNNRGIESCISISTNANNLLTTSYTKIQKNTFSGNEGMIISLLENILMA